MEFHDLPFFARFIALALFYLMLGWIISGNEDFYQICGILGFLGAIFAFAPEISDGHW